MTGVITNDPRLFAQLPSGRSPRVAGGSAPALDVAALVALDAQLRTSSVRDAPARRARSAR